MKCKACNGTGYITACVYESDEIGFVDKNYECAVCHGTGQIEQTNEEWLKSLDTEGLVDYLFEVHKGGNSVERRAWIEKHKERAKMQIRGWLKEVHKDG